MAVIVCCVDGSEAGRGAACWAAATAAGRGATLRLVHVRTAPWAGWSPRNANSEVLFAMNEQAQRHLEAERDELARSLPGLTIELAVRLLDSPTRALLAESQDALLTVIGTSPSSYPAGISGRSVAAALATFPGVAVAVVPSRVPSAVGPAPGKNVGPVVLGIGDPEEEDSAVEFAFEEAAVRGCDLIAVRSWNHRSLEQAMTAYPMSGAYISIDERERRTVSAKIAHSAARHPGVPVLSWVRYGHPVAVLRRPPPIDRTGSAAPQLIVVGGRARGRIAAFLLGSTSRALLSRATCPVAVIQG